MYIEDWSELKMLFSPVTNEELQSVATAVASKHPMLVKGAKHIFIHEVILSVLETSPSFNRPEGFRAFCSLVRKSHEEEKGRYYASFDVFDDSYGRWLQRRNGGIH